MGVGVAKPQQKFRVCPSVAQEFHSTPCPVHNGITMKLKSIAFVCALSVCFYPSGSALVDQSSIAETLGGVQIECPTQIKAMAGDGVLCAVTSQVPLQIGSAFSSTKFAVQRYPLNIARIIYSLNLPENYPAGGELVAWVESPTDGCARVFSRISFPICIPDQHQPPSTTR